MIASLFQLDVYVPANQAMPGFLDPWVWLESPWLARGLLVLLVAFGVFTAVFALRWALHRRHRYRGAFDAKILQVKVPKELRKEDTAQEKSQQQLQELIGKMETVFATIGSMKPQSGFMAWWRGRDDHLSLEIVIDQEKINFFIVTPSKWQAFVEEQVHAQYPFASIDEAPDYNIFTPTGVALASYVVLRRPSAFALKTYRKLEADPMNALTNALAKVESGDGAAIQILTRPIENGWRKYGVKIASQMQ